MDLPADEDLVARCAAGDRAAFDLLVEQFARAALEVADYAYVMERGRIAIEGTPAELRQHERVVAAYLG